jgi:hypothetical protein
VAGRQTASAAPAGAPLRCSVALHCLHTLPGGAGQYLKPPPLPGRGTRCAEYATWNSPRRDNVQLTVQPGYGPPLWYDDKNQRSLYINNSTQTHHSVQWTRGQVSHGKLAWALRCLALPQPALRCLNTTLIQSAQPHGAHNKTRGRG